MMLTYWVHSLHLIYVHGAEKLPAGDATSCSQPGRPGTESPVSACRPRPWWTCSHGEVIHDVTTVSCRWRTDRGLSNQSTENCLTKATVLKKIYTLSVWLFTRLLGGFSGLTNPNSSQPAKRWCFVFPGDFKVKVKSPNVLFYFHFIDGDRQLSSLKLLKLE